LVAETGIILTVAYDGTPFSGWALQANAPSVTGVLLEAVRSLHPEVREIRGASRTDAGVHARNQRACFDVETTIPPRGWALALGKRLPSTVSVRAVALSEPGYIPRFRGIGKRYVYTWLVDKLRDPFLDRFAYRVPLVPSLEAMQAEAAQLLGTHDFQAFRSSADVRKMTTRMMRRASVERDERDGRLLHFTIEGDHFLHNMVRIIAGTLLDVGMGRRRPGCIERAIRSGNREDLGLTAPAHGLTLDEVYLDDEGTDRWPPRPSVASGEEPAWPRRSPSGPVASEPAGPDA
jgi:tRNA pseudouridine38-40 synthase